MPDILLELKRKLTVRQLEEVADQFKQKEPDEHDALKKFIESVVKETLKTQDLNTAAPVSANARTSGITGTVRKRPGSTVRIERGAVVKR
jgi:hypothetical protein